MVLYLTVSLFAVVMSYNEQFKDPDRSWAATICALVACLFWPLSLCAVAYVARREGQTLPEAHTQTSGRVS